MKDLLRALLTTFVVFGTLTALSCSGLRRSGGQVTAENAVPYAILYDKMDTVIKIGVSSSVTEQQLRTTLAKAANDHQDDRARDYLMSMYLWVEAFLVEGDKQSNVRAGHLKRYLPPGNPEERRQITDDRTKDDTFTITLKEAKNSMH
jgi:hypothetical protein